MRLSSCDNWTEIIDVIARKVIYWILKRIREHVNEHEKNDHAMEHIFKLSNKIEKSPKYQTPLIVNLC